MHVADVGLEACPKPGGALAGYGIDYGVDYGGDGFLNEAILIEFTDFRTRKNTRYEMVDAGMGMVLCWSQSSSRPRIAARNKIVKLQLPNIGWRKARNSLPFEA